MCEPSTDLLSKIRAAATKAVQLYAQGILSVESLTEQIVREWKLSSVSKEYASHSVFMRLAQRICSRELYSAWRSPQKNMRNCAFDNLRRYLEQSLLRSGYAAPLHNCAISNEDVLHQTLEILQRMLTQETNPGPDDPATFLKWTQTILLRQAHASLNKCKRDTCLSLDEQAELFPDQFGDKVNGDPLEQVLLLELQRTLIDTLTSMHNARYRQILIYTYLAGMDDQELARRFNASVQTIYQWRFRALRALRSNPEVIKLLHSLLA
ncbi:MAG: sigma-70 family RNA polymerase sigma factor [Chloroflexi bacterium]|nr:sigma-70 family RNA polymerase sigma factor [Ktedonobacteraceae bacterium]MBV9706609.1 sigma-70 family RNA polymerase sigma factor [Chloroflexota bacterium]